MSGYQRLMVADDTFDDETHTRLGFALDKAVAIEHGSSAAVQVVQIVYSSVPDDQSAAIPEPERARLIERMKARERHALNELQQRYAERIATLSSKVVWAKDAASAITAEACEERANLIIKPIARHTPLGDLWHTPTDWALMRTAPCPVLTVRNVPWKHEPRILAAVDAGDTEHDRLNAGILRAAGNLAAAVGGTLHVSSAYPGLMQAVNEYQVAIDYEPMKADMRAARETAIDRWTKELGLEPADVRLLEGEASKELARYASDINADVIVLGTAARSGLKRLLVGNTAEKIVCRVGCDVMTVRDI